MSKIKLLEVSINATASSLEAYKKISYLLARSRLALNFSRILTGDISFSPV
jgi:hypothetical protein